MDRPAWPGASDNFIAKPVLGMLLPHQIYFAAGPVAIALRAPTC